MLCKPGGERPDLLDLAALFAVPQERCTCNADATPNAARGSRIIDEDDAMPCVLEKATNGDVGAGEAALQGPNNSSQKISHMSNADVPVDSTLTRGDLAFPPMSPMPRTARLYRPSAAPNIVQSELGETKWVLVYDLQKRQLDAVPRDGYDCESMPVL